MKNISKIFAALAILVVLGAPAVNAGNDYRRGTAGANELLINPWARSTGWGGVNVSGVTGLNAMYNNVAGLAFTKKFEVAYSNTIYGGGSTGQVSAASINTFGLGIRVLESGVLGVYVMTMGFGDIDVTTYERPDGGNGTFSPSFMNINLAYAHSFTRSIHGGVNFRLISESTDNVTATGFSIDAGIQYVTGAKDQLKFGISLKNWGPTMSFDGTGLSLTMINAAGNNFTVETRSAEIELPTCLNIGVSYDFLFEKWDQRLTASAAFTSNAFLRDNYGLGLEYSLLNMFQVRCGYVFQSGLWDEDDRATANAGFHAGASIDVPFSKKNENLGLSLDYSYRTMFNLNGTHAIGLSLRF